MRERNRFVWTILLEERGNHVIQVVVEQRSHLPIVQAEADCHEILVLRLPCSVECLHGFQVQERLVVQYVGVEVKPSVILRERVVNVRVALFRVKDKRAKLRRTRQLIIEFFDGENGSDTVHVNIFALGDACEAPLGRNRINKEITVGIEVKVFVIDDLRLHLKNDRTQLRAISNEQHHLSVAQSHTLSGPVGFESNSGC